MMNKNYNTRLADYALEHSESKGTARAVIFYLALRADTFQITCETVLDIMKATGHARNTIFRAINKLEDLGELKRVRKSLIGNVYHVFPEGVTDDYRGFTENENKEEEK